MNSKLYQHTGRLTDSERKLDRGAFFRSIHGTLNHLLLADRIWMLRFTGDEARFASRNRAGELIAVRSLNQELYTDFDELTEQRAQTDAQILAWTGALDAEALGRTFTYTAVNGSEHSHVLWWAVSHFFNHQTHHRGQVTTLLMQAGVDPGVTDLLAMFRNEAAFAKA
jgi:uncharacterized damage-inducible protein DinB